MCPRTLRKSNSAVATGQVASTVLTASAELAKQSHLCGRKSSATSHSFALLRSNPFVDRPSASRANSCHSGTRAKPCR